MRGGCCSKTFLSAANVVCAGSMDGTDDACMTARYAGTLAFCMSKRMDVSTSLRDE